MSTLQIYHSSGVSSGKRLYQDVLCKFFSASDERNATDKLVETLRIKNKYYEAEIECTFSDSLLQHDNSSSEAKLAVFNEISLVPKNINDLVSYFGNSSLKIICLECPHDRIEITSEILENDIMVVNVQEECDWNGNPPHHTTTLCLI